MKKTTLLFSVTLVAILVLALGTGFALLSKGQKQPQITWEPEAITATLAPGDSKTIQVSFTSSENVKDVMVRVVPELASFVQTEPSLFNETEEGQVVTLSVNISAAPNASLGTFEGTIQLREVDEDDEGDEPEKSRTLAKPLPVVVNIWQKLFDSKEGFSLLYPPDWSKEVLEPLVLLSSPETNIKRSDPEETHVPSDVRVQVLSNPQNLNAMDFALQFDDGWFSRYAQQGKLTVDGRAAIKFNDIDSEVSRAPVLAIFIALSQDRVLLLTSPGYEGDLNPERLDAWEQIIQSLEFD